MEKDEATDNLEEKSDHSPFRVRLPGFVADEDIGLGGVFKRATSAVGIKPCGGCERRAAVLDRWLVFTGWHTK